MQKLSAVFIIFILAALAASSGCQTTQAGLEASGKSYVLSGIPGSIVKIEINDLRSEKNDSVELIELLTAETKAALSKEVIEGFEGYYTLRVDILEHQCASTKGQWKASTRFRLTLLRTDGSQYYTGLAKASYTEGNVQSFRIRQRLLQRSYNGAFDNLMTMLADIKLDY